MKLSSYGIQRPAGEQIEKGTLISGMLGGEPFVGLTVSDRHEDAVVILAGGNVPSPSLILREAIEGVLGIIDGEAFVEPTDDTLPFRLPRAGMMPSGALAIGPDGSLGIRVDHNQHGRPVASVFSFETGEHWAHRGPGFSALGWRLMVRHPMRAEPFLLAGFDE